MKRDMELVRKLLLFLEEKPDHVVLEKVELEGYDPVTIGHHLVVLYEAGYIEGEPQVSTSSQGEAHERRRRHPDRALEGAAPGDAARAVGSAGMITALADALDSFYLAYLHCGELDAGVEDGSRVDDVHMGGEHALIEEVG
jgi:DNA-binding transcriptional ArsR family regulator